MGRYLGAAGFGSEIGNFYAMQGFVSLFMPRPSWVSSLTAGSQHSAS